MSPTERTLAVFRRLGWTCAVTERWNHHAKVRQDLFGFLDILAIRGPGFPTTGIGEPSGCGIIGLQVTTAANLASRRFKILAESRAREWLLAGGRIQLWGWGKRGDGPAKAWKPRIEEAFLDGRGGFAFAESEYVGR